ncbi:hypothetical protein [uncultured Roseobacter sp.]|uniref:hypothetical protein n=1 Tax=uncultured Roseobacter sp. TaxID=114847 RepID=UPI00260485D4|nr:hypothetical protein [uncultured Roseobacter sp.]
MIRRVLILVFMFFVTAVVVYLSRFWTWSFWPRSGLFGIEELRPQGGLLGRWLRGTDAAPYELLIWAVGVFVLLSLLQKIWDKLPSGKDQNDG